MRACVCVCVWLIVFVCVCVVFVFIPHASLSLTSFSDKADNDMSKIMKQSLPKSLQEFDLAQQSEVDSDRE